MLSVSKSVTVAVLVMSLTALGCGGTFSSSDGGPLDLVPSDVTQIEQWDVAKLLNEEGPLVKGFEDQWETVLEGFGIFIDDLNTLTRSWSGDGVLVIAEGDLDFEDIRDALHDGDFRERTWQGYELWEGRSSAGIRAMAVLEDEGYAVLGTTSEVIREVLKSVARETGFLSSDENSAQDMNRAWDKTGSGVLREVREECRVEDDIRGCNASAFAVNFPAGNGISALEATAVFLFRNERTAESQANRMGKFYREAQDSNPSWSPPVSLPTGPAQLSIEVSGPEVDGEFAIFLITFAVQGEGSLDDGREQVLGLTPRIAAAIPSTVSPVRKATPRVAVPSTPDAMPVKVVSVPSTPDVTPVKRGPVPSTRDVITVVFDSLSTPYVIPVQVVSPPSTPDTNDMSPVVPADMMGNHVGEWVTVKGKLDAELLADPIDTELGTVYWLSFSKGLGILIRHEHVQIVPEEFANWAFRGNGTVCVYGKVSKSYEFFTEGEVIVNPTRDHHIRIGC